MSKEEYMKEALREAERAYELDEVPVGAVVVKDGEIIARAHNEKEERECALYHAEMLALRRAAAAVGDWHLYGCDLYVTLEPCAMCAGACVNSRIDNIYFGAYDAKAGCCGTLYDLPSDTRFNHRPNVEGGIYEGECAAILSRFFAQKRVSKRSQRKSEEI